MKRITLFLALSLVTAFFSACNTTEPTVNTFVGKIAIDDFITNAAYSWYQVGYQAFPLAENQTTFNQNVAAVKAAFDSTQHSVLIVIKPTCSCQNTQTYMPRVMKTLDMAGVPHNRISLYVTDARMIGFDEVKDKFKINAAPTFIILRNDVEKGRIVEFPDAGKTVDGLMAEFFVKP